MALLVDPIEINKRHLWDEVVAKLNAYVELDRYCAYGGNDDSEYAMGYKAMQEHNELASYVKGFQREMKEVFKIVGND